jgi:hypothetical protein
LIDNATLTGLQRITGQIKTKTYDSVDTDIIALENIVQAILFYDRIIAIDNYIPRHREERIASFPYIQFIDEKIFKLDALGEEASKIANGIRPEIRGGEFANDDFKKLFELLKTHVVCTWDLNSSIYYLNLKCLAEQESTDFKKYGNLAAGIFAELMDSQDAGVRTTNDVELVDRYGRIITPNYKVPGAKWGSGTTGGVSGAIKAFVASLTWLANRSIFYSLSGKYLQADTFLYPIRQVYQQYYIGKTCNYGQNYPKHLVDHFSSSLSQDIFEIHQGGLVATTGIDLPIFSAWLAHKTGDPSLIIEAAFSLREASDIKDMRDNLREVRRLFDESEIADANKAVLKVVNDIKKTSKSIRINYGIETQQGVPVTRLVQAYNSIAALKGFPSLPDIDLKIKMPDFFQNIRKQSGFCSLYRNISKDLSTVWSLGKARDILGSKVDKDKDAIAYNPKGEDPKYKNVHSNFKSPM